MTKEEFEAWQAHPVTRFVFRYLKDRQESVQGQWKEGNNWTEESRYFVQSLQDMRDLELSDIEQFYEDPNEQDRGIPEGTG